MTCCTGPCDAYRRAVAATSELLDRAGSIEDVESAWATRRAACAVCYQGDMPQPVHRTPKQRSAQRRDPNLFEEPA